MANPEQDDDTLAATFVAPDDVVEASGHPIPTVGSDSPSDTTTCPTMLRFDAEQDDLLEVRVDDTAVEYDSSLSAEQLDAVIASLAPVDVNALISAATEPPDA